MTQVNSNTEPESERKSYFPQGSLRRCLMSGAFWSLVGAVFSRGLSLTSSIIIARLLGKAGYGQWGLIMAAIAMFAPLAGFGAALTATKHVAELRKSDPVRGGRTLSLILLVGLISVSMMSLVCLGLARLISHTLYHIPGLFVPLMLSSIMLFGMVGTLILQGALAGFQDFRCIAWISVAQGGVLLLASVPLTWQFGIVGTVIGVSISHVVAMVLCLTAVIKRSREDKMVLSPRQIWQERSLLWDYAAPSLLTGVVIGPATVLSQAMVANIAGGIVGLGGFQAAVRWREAVLFIPMAVKRVTLPMLSSLWGENQYHRIKKALWANIALNGGIAVVVSLPIMILGRWILSLYGSDFHQDWDMIIILVGSAVFQAINDVVTQVTACMEKMWWRFANTVVWGIILLGGSYLLVPIFGVRGYVWSMVSAVVIHMVLNSVAAFILVRRVAPKKKLLKKTNSAIQKKDKK